MIANNVLVKVCELFNEVMRNNDHIKLKRTIKNSHIFELANQHGNECNLDA